MSKAVIAWKCSQKIVHDILFILRVTVLDGKAVGVGESFTCQFAVRYFHSIDFCVMVNKILLENVAELHFSDSLFECLYSLFTLCDSFVFCLFVSVRCSWWLTITLKWGPSTMSLATSWAARNQVGGNHISWLLWGQSFMRHVSHHRVRTYLLTCEWQMYSSFQNCASKQWWPNI